MYNDISVNIQEWITKNILLINFHDVVSMSGGKSITTQRCFVSDGLALLVLRPYVYFWW